MNAYRPAMEFAGRVDFEQTIITWRPAAKWAPRIKVGDLIEVERVHQRKPGRFFARVTAVDHRPPPEHEARRLALIYKPVPALIRIELVIELDATRNDPRYVTWETKTTRAHRARRH